MTLAQCSTILTHSERLHYSWIANIQPKNVRRNKWKDILMREMKWNKWNVLSTIIGLGSWFIRWRLWVHTHILQSNLYMAWDQGDLAASSFEVRGKRKCCASQLFRLSCGSTSGFCKQSHIAYLRRKKRHTFSVFDMVWMVMLLFLVLLRCCNMSKCPFCSFFWRVYWCRFFLFLRWILYAFCAFCNRSSRCTWIDDIHIASSLCRFRSSVCLHSMCVSVSLRIISSLPYFSVVLRFPRAVDIF